MALAPRTRFGSYEVVEQIGAGGMGEVYLATDTTLDRDVALKALPPAFVEDADRVARLEQEAKTLASLNHPNIAQVYGFESNAGITALVMELVDGPTLADRIEQGPLPPDEALGIAMQIAAGLEAAHSLGIVHRDLKPANIKLKGDGTVKLLDFGIAKALGARVDSSGGSVQSMTTPAMTQAGIILGTAAYMSPEQARSKPLDQRADIWAFGCVLFEMLTGQPAFGGEDVTITLARVLERSADLSALPGTIAPAVRQTIELCLEKNVNRRIADIRDVRIALEGRFEPVSAAKPSWWQVRPVAIGLVAGILLTAAIAASMLDGQPGNDDAGLTHLSIPLPRGHVLLSGPAISRDGRRVAFTSSDGIERPRLYVRFLDEAESRQVPGTEEALQPFFSPNGESVAYYGQGALWRVNLNGGAPVRLADADTTAVTGGTWLDDGRIVFKRTWNTGLYSIPENGGEASLLVGLNSEDEYAYTYPYAVPGTSEIVFNVWAPEGLNNIARLDLDSMSRQSLGGEWRRSVYVSTGHIVYAGDGELLAMPYADELRESAGAISVLQGVDTGYSGNGDARFDVSYNGVLAFAPAERKRSSLVIVDAAGNIGEPIFDERDYSSFSLAPDGRRIAATVQLTGVSVHDLERGSSWPLAPELQNQGTQFRPVWSPDGARITFASNHEGNWNIFARAATGSGEFEPVVQRPFDQYPTSYAPDGALLFNESDPESRSDIWILEPGAEPRPLVATGAAEQNAAFSPDGSMIAYASDVSGRLEVYLRERESDDQLLRVSVNGGDAPRWSRDGSWLYFRSGGSLLAARIDTTDGLTAGIPEALFNGGLELAQLGAFEVMPDGESFLMARQAPDSLATRIDIVTNWSDELERLMPVN